ncbi:hypothetical protein [Methanocorpusculum vombati]|uniref:Archaeal Type IV pilin N-terminal domain-containing protein n=1 Tax=Methanocorpusculum vombati TaxID=3002864 RepID=A0ABT4IJV6_9EURY|nr:hypothetical protein [Methanocorpusculum vombati]MCZ9319483.1 hypothetical protein [Methanocorpusculum sp.]MCZ0862025.1 hypothetical protein [Methanocorpusculum vombati]MDE2520420.1 hypothetical protein [Methanocorpusculum sp.]MDE2534089.1 hypothetical protein [Methanocorpusculum sp.]MDE2546568.1 hypothetical protein [Methanocorpusculum sp.]
MTLNASARFDYLYSVKQSGSRVSLSPVIVVLLAIGIVAVLIFVGLCAMTEIADISHANVDVTARVSGNDVMITVIGSDDARHVTGICAYIDGAAEGKQTVFRTFPGTGETIVFPDIAAGVFGSAFVIIEAQFDDGTTDIVNYVRLQFS